MWTVAHRVNGMSGSKEVTRELKFQAGNDLNDIEVISRSIPSPCHVPADQRFESTAFSDYYPVIIY